jgi:hypothetical protein
MLREIDGIFFAFWLQGGIILQAEVDFFGKGFIKKMDTVRPADKIDPATFVEPSCNVHRLQLHPA